MANEKLTMQALIEHDRVQPTLKAPKGSGTSNSSAVKEVYNLFELVIIQDNFNIFMTLVCYILYVV